jgi:hypothetical protein
MFGPFEAEQVETSSIIALDHQGHLLKGTVFLMILYTREARR